MIRIFPLLLPIMLCVSCYEPPLRVPSDYEAPSDVKYVEGESDSIGPDGLPVPKSLEKDTIFHDSVVLKINIRSADKFVYFYIDSTGFWDGESHEPMVFSASISFLVTDATMDKVLLQATIEKMSYSLNHGSTTTAISYDSEAFVPGRYDRLQSIIGRQYYLTLKSNGQIVAADGLLEIVNLMGPEFADESSGLVPDFPFLPYRFVRKGENWQTKGSEGGAVIHNDYTLEKAFDETAIVRKTILSKNINHTTDYNINLRSGMPVSIKSDRRRNYRLDEFGKKRPGEEVYVRYVRLAY